MYAVVKTRQGEVRGGLADGAPTFKGIRYAAAPFGAHRFLAPQSVEPWRGARSRSCRPW
jgi:para-nitrobenzyl esterase